MALLEGRLPPATVLEGDLVYAQVGSEAARRQGNADSANDRQIDR